MINAVIFDLDGVIVSTDECHYLAWQKMADDAGFKFDREMNDQLRGVSRMDCLDIILGNAAENYSQEEKVEFAKKKNDLYVSLIRSLNPNDMMAGAKKTLEELKVSGIKIAIGSSSKNTPTILRQIGLFNYFDAVADGNDITKSKPDPEVFLLAMKLMNKQVHECLVVEDAMAGVEAALSAGMQVLAVGSASSSQRATITAKSLNAFSVIDWINSTNKDI